MADDQPARLSALTSTAARGTSRSWAPWPSRASSSLRCASWADRMPGVTFGGGLPSPTGRFQPCLAPATQRPRARAIVRSSGVGQDRQRNLNELQRFASMLRETVLGLDALPPTTCPNDEAVRPSPPGLGELRTLSPFGVPSPVSPTDHAAPHLFSRPPVPPQGPCCARGEAPAG